jgi:hypothetical protein
MSETLATSAKLGFISDGFNGSVFVFDNPLNKVGRSSPTTNYGVSLGYAMPCDQLGWDLGVSYLHNLLGVNDIAYQVNNNNSGGGASSTTGYHSRVGGLALYGDVNSGPFTLGARYTAALHDFSVLDLSSDGIADRTPSAIDGVLLSDASGARPWAAGIQVGYNFTAWCDNSQNLFVGYQTSREAAGLNIPRSRWLAGYNIDMWKNTNFGIEYDNDRDYRVSQGGTNETTSLFSLRASVKFS